MTREELALVLGAADRFVRKELGPHLAALDLDPRSARVDAVEALARRRLPAVTGSRR